MPAKQDEESHPISLIQLVVKGCMLDHNRRKEEIRPLRDSRLVGVNSEKRKVGS